jgi:gluconate:H+ symporter, GntP family
MIGALLQQSGGATAIAQWLVSILGIRHIGWTMLLVGLLVGVGVWFTVGLVLLVPVAVSLSRVARVNLLVPAMSMLAGLSAMHGLAPPHPGPLAAIELLGADLGRTILWSLLVGSISAALAGPVFWRLFAGRIDLLLTDKQAETEVQPSDSVSKSGLLAPLVVIVLPIVLMLLGSFVSTVTIFASLGHPTMAMLIGFALAYILLGIHNGQTNNKIAELTQASLSTVANVLLVVAAGAGYSKVLIASGVGETLGELAKQVPLPTLVLGWLVAVAFRVATGSATTAITAAGGILSVMIEGDGSVNRELLVLALGAGSLALSHVNDGGFWFVKELFSLTVPQTLRTWTVLETVLSLVTLVVVLVFDRFVQ